MVEHAASGLVLVSSPAETERTILGSRNLSQSVLPAREGERERERETPNTKQSDDTNQP